MIAKGVTVQTGVLPPFAVAWFTVHPERCLNRHYLGANCARCAESCPVAAIQVDRDIVQVDKASCVRCGVCVRACPPELFVETRSPEMDLGAEVRRSVKADIEIACPLAVENGRRGKTTIHSRVPQATCFIAPRCLGAMSAANWLEMTEMGQRAVWVHDEPCATCPISHAHKQIQTAVQEANAWLALVGRETAVFTYTGNHFRLTETTQQKPAATPVSQPAKRAFLRKVIGREVMSSEAVVANGRLPQSRRHLLKLLQKTSPLDVFDTTKLPLTNVIIDETKCSACGICARLCPTHTLRFVTDEEDVFGLFFLAGNCLDCGICASACPEQAIAYGAEVVGEALGRGSSRIAAGLLQTCADCPTLISTHMPHSRCHTCRQQSALPNFLK